MLHLPTPKPNCPRCENTTFGRAEVDVNGTDFTMAAICCMKCGAAISFEERYDNNALILEQNEAIKAIAGALNLHVQLTLRR